MKRTILRISGLAIVAGLAAGAATGESLTDVGSEVVACRAIEADDARLACYDAAAATLSDTLETAAAEAPEAESVEVADNDMEAKLPFWARIAPGADKKQVNREKKEKVNTQPEEMEVVIISVFQNNAGRYFFKTDDGQLWQQVEIEKIKEPKQLPAKGRIWKSVYGAPWFEFDDLSWQDFKVKRVK
ncbi:MAG: hypothetical protein R3C13_01725 [Hyphomonas sp.]|uniref:hypothetical protein n=1 Tax=Hyphomonas sp. TaxID=87 RepID=UPI003529C157